jgi:hypothetical protein
VPRQLCGKPGSIVCPNARCEAKYCTHCGEPKPEDHRCLQGFGMIKDWVAKASRNKVKVGVVPGTSLGVRWLVALKSSRRLYQMAAVPPVQQCCREGGGLSAYALCQDQVGRLWLLLL